MSNESNTNRMVHEEQGIVRRPRWSLITVRGASTVGTEATQIASEVLQSKAGRGKDPEAAMCSPRDDEMNAGMHALYG